MHVVTEDRELCIVAVNFGFDESTAKKKGLCVSLSPAHEEATAFHRQCEDPLHGGGAIVKVGNVLCPNVDPSRWVLRTLRMSNLEALLFNGFRI